MGAWGGGSFENDDASDWVWSLEQANDDTVLRQALAVVAEAAPDDYVEAPDASCAIAAAEVVAAGKGAAASNLPDEVRQWLDTHATAIGSDLVGRARESVARIREKSELRELWDEAGDPEWDAAVADLQRRLEVAASA